MAKKGKLVKKLKGEMKDFATKVRRGGDYEDTEKISKARKKCIDGGGRFTYSQGYGMRCIKDTPESIKE